MVVHVKAPIPSDEGVGVRIPITACPAWVTFSWKYEVTHVALAVHANAHITSVERVTLWVGISTTAWTARFDLAVQHWFLS